MIEYRRIIIHILILGIVLFAAAAFCEDEPVNPEFPYPLEEVTVTAGAISSQIGACTAFDTTLIELNPGNSLDDVLALTPGAMIKVGSRGEAEFSVRGAISRDTKLYIDGRPAASPWGGYMDFSGLALADIFEVFIIKGPPPLKYGSNLGGAVNIRTIDPSREAVTKFSAEYGSGDAFKTALSQTGAVSEVLFRAGLSVEGREGFPVASDFQASELENGGLRDNSDNFRYSGSAKFYLPYFQGKTVLSLGYSDEERGIPPNAIEFPRRWRFKYWKRCYADLKHQRKNLWGEFESNMYFDAYANRLKRYNDDEYNESDYMYDSKHLSRVFGWDGNWKIDWSRKFRVDLGFRTHYDLFSRREQTPQSGGFSNPEYHYALIGDLFAETSYKAIPLMEISTGLAMLNRRDESEDIEVNLAPRLGISFAPVRKLRAAVNIAHSVQYPTFLHLYDESSGNPELEPETAWRGEIGGQYFLGHRTAISVWYYRTFIEGRIDRINKVSQFLNITDSELWGEELTIAHKGARFSASLGVTYQTVKLDQIPGAQFPIMGDDTPSWKIDLWYSVKPYDELTFYMNAGYLSGMDYSGNDIDERVLVDITSVYEPADWLELKGSIENVLDEDYSTEYGFPQPGRVWKAGFGLIFD